MSGRGHWPRGDLAEMVEHVIGDGGGIVGDRDLFRAGQPHQPGAGDEGGGDRNVDRSGTEAEVWLFPNRMREAGS